ncbi:hypothetical protein AtEden1_Chr2g0222751 [Arabidopsis thaliana]
MFEIRFYRIFFFFLILSSLNFWTMRKHLYISSPVKYLGQFCSRYYILYIHLHHPHPTPPSFIYAIHIASHILHIHLHHPLPTHSCTLFTSYTFIYTIHFLHTIHILHIYCIYTSISHPTHTSYKHSAHIPILKSLLPV